MNGDDGEITVGVVSGFLYVGGRRVNGWQHWGESRGAREKKKQA